MKFITITTVTICKLIQDIIKTIVLTKCYDVWTINATIRVLTTIYYSHKRKTCPAPIYFIIVINVPPHCGHVFQETGTILKLVKDIIRTIVLIKFHEDWTIKVTLKVKNTSPPVFTRKNAPPTDIIGTNLLTKKNTPPPGGHVLQPTQTIFELVQDIIGTYLLTMFHDDWIRNMAFRILTRKNAPPPWRSYIITINVSSRVLTRKHAPPPSCHVFKAAETIFKLFHDDRKINVASRALTRKNAPPPGGFVFLPIGIIFELVQYITCIGMNHVTKVLTTGNARLLAAMFFKQFANLTIFKLIQDIIETNLLAKFHEDWK
ncbi:hypothetical protein DPMN_029139 [Dreissena polymorpha]|uniref:Uncharacterized protein n=1 Tax=Dreissena polymorpha TaxID=45954 RepID=A0A9D4RGU2_DREPO|nr:hypothetical protein DPMN_029139 [Dreissena polymorpha]